MRDSAGYVIGAMCERVSLPTSPAVVEGLAHRRALVFLQKNCVSECFVKGDAEVIINTIQARDTRNPKYGHLIGDNLVLSADLGICNFSFVKRIGNLVVHFLKL